MPCPLFSPVWVSDAKQTWNLKCGSVTKPEKAGKHYRIQKTQQHNSTNPLIGSSSTKPSHELAVLYYTIETKPGNYFNGLFWFYRVIKVDS